MNVRWALPKWTFIALFLIAARSEAQVMGPPGAMPGPYPVSMMGGAGGAPPGYGAGAMPGGLMMEGQDAAIPDGMSGYGGYGEAEDGYGSFDGEYGGEDCGPYRGLLGDFLGLVGPYNDGGCCAPRFYDVSFEAMWLRRESPGRNQDFSSLGINGPRVLSTNDLDLTERPSFKVSAMVQFRSAGNLEFTYYGLFNNRDTAQVNSAGNNLYSSLSQFGTVPPGGFLEDSNAAYQRIEYSSEFSNFEFNYRRHWQGPGCRFQGSWLYGIRYFQLDEDFDFISVSTVNASQLKYNVNVNNSLTGGQTGGDIWACVIPGLRIGAEGKVGVYGNHAQQGSRISTFSPALATVYNEAVKENDVAFVGDAALMMTYRINYQFNIKLGYNFLYVEGVTLATENYNSTPPSVLGGGATRTPSINDNGSVFYHGASGGLEYNW